MRKLRIGIFGTGRGLHLASDFIRNGCEIAAVCDFHPARLQKAVDQLGPLTAAYTDFDDFIGQDMDAVVLANYFHEHALYAVKCFERGLHVYSECISNGTMAEGVELVRAFEKSSSIYMLAENYPQMIFNREIKRVCDSGVLGKILYAEGEYNHPISPYDTSFLDEYIYFRRHWRNFTPRTYYVTHSLGPIMWSTGASPVRVTAFGVFAPVVDGAPTARFAADRAALIMTQNDDGSVFRFTGCAAFGGHHNAYRVCGTEGQIENLRGTDNEIMLRRNAWSLSEGEEEVSRYKPSWNDPDEEIISGSGHGGSDYLTIRTFVNCIREGVQPEHPFDIYSAVRMSSVAILAHRSMLDGGRPIDIPDMRSEEARSQYENDRLTPFYGTDGSEPNIPCCSVTDYAPTEEQMELFDQALGVSAN